MKKYIMSIDQGTTGSTILILDKDLNVIAKNNREFPQIYPKPGWVEHNPEDIWQSILTSMEQAFAQGKIDPNEISAIGITNQRETTVIWEGEQGNPVHNAIVWQCRRTAGHCEKLKKDGYENLFRKKTGLVLDPYFSGTKISWLLENVDQLREKAQSGKAKFGTIDSYVVYKLTGGKAHVTDVSNASRTLLMNLESLEWDDELLKILKIPREMLPKISPSSFVYGETKGVPGLPDAIPISGIAGDQQAALFGQACFQPGDSKCTYGTGSFLLINTGNKAIPSKRGMLTTVGWKIADQVTYALEGSTFIAGAAVQWLRDGLKIISNAKEVENLAKEVPDHDGVYFVPAFVGLGAPYWRANAKGIIYGITRGTSKAHIARATLEGIAFQIADLIGAMEEDFGKKISLLKVDGGAAVNNLLMQFQSDITNRTLIRPTLIETTALGSAFLAGLATGFWMNTSIIQKTWKVDQEFRPQISENERHLRLTEWRQVIDNTLGITRD